MNIIFDIEKFILAYTYFLEAKRNMIMDGTFSKIIYSNEVFTLNGIYLYLPLEIQSIEKNINKYIIKFYPSSPINMSLVQELSRIEYKILEYYKQINYINNKKSLCSLTKQLYSGNLKVYKDYNEIKCISDKISTYIVKISGIWENSEGVGITYKVFESYPAI